MPSPLELLGSGDAANQPGPPSDDVLGSVKAEGGRRRGHRRRRNLAVALLGLGLLAVPAAVGLRSGDVEPEEMSVAADGGGLAPDIAPVVDELTSVPGLVPGDPPPTIPDPATLATVPPPVDPTPTPTSTPTPRPTPTPSADPSSPDPAATTTPTTAANPQTPTTTAAARVCRNSTDPACGQFRWDPAPSPNQPLVAEFTKAPTTAVAGTPVTFEVAWSDGDAGLTYQHFSTNGTVLNIACSEPARYGPWTPPAAAAGSGTLPFTTTFANPGQYLVTVSLGTAECSASPYWGEKTINMTITVTAAQAG